MLALSPQSTLQQGKYIIQRVLGQGGFGITYEGLQTGLNRRVAIKEFFMRDSCERSGRDVMVVGTEDHADLRYMLYHKTDCTLDGAIEDGTAIGDALTCALNQLKDSKAANRVVVLLTDGSNNCGEISPLTAASMAEVLGVRVYTVALGTKGMARYPLRDGDRIKYIQIPTEVDSASLCPIAERTHGCFYQTDNVDVLHKIIDIDLAEEMGIFPDTDPSAVSSAMSREEVDRLLDAAASREEVVQMKVRVASGI